MDVGDEVAQALAQQEPDAACGASHKLRTTLDNL
jgi:hypothetical protein